MRKVPTRRAGWEQHSEIHHFAPSVYLRWRAIVQALVAPDSLRSFPMAVQDGPIDAVSTLGTFPHLQMPDFHLLTQILEKMADGVALFDADFRYLFWNAAMEQISGVGRRRALGVSALELSPFLQDTGAEEFLQGALEGKSGTWQRTFQQNLEIRRQQVLEVRYSPVFAENERIVAGLAIVRDLTDYHAAAEAAQTQQKKTDLYRQIFANSVDAIAIINPDGRYLEQNPAHATLTGFSDEDLQGQTPAIHLGQEAFAKLADELASHGSWRGELVSHTRQGTKVPIEISAFAVKKPSGEPICYVGIKRDVTEHRRSEQVLREQAMISETLHWVGTALAAELDLNKLVQTATDAATQIAGAQVGAFLYRGQGHSGEPQTLYALAGPAAKEFSSFPAQDKAPLFDPVFRVERTIRCDDLLQDSRHATTVPFRGLPPEHPTMRSYLAVPVVSRRGEVLGGLFFGHSEPGIFDERDERIIESIAAQAATAIDNARLYEAEQKARAQAETASRAKDQFLAMLSHELRTPLTPVLATVSAMETSGTLPPDLQRDIKLIRRNVELETKLIDDLLDLTRISRGKLELTCAPADVHDKIRHVAHICQADLTAKRLELRLDMAAEHYVVNADGPRLQQVLWNLLKNAVKFTPEGGRIEIRTRNQPLEPGTPESGKQAEENANAEENHNPTGDLQSIKPPLVIDIIDSGIGIEPDVLPKLFDAFEQGGRDITRQFGGLGLGLAISKTIVDLHGGTLTAQSHGRNSGATFTIVLPTVSAAPSSKPVHKSDMSGQPRNCRILLVEDHPDTSAVMERLLTARGHQVRIANSVGSA